MITRHEWQAGGANRAGNAASIRKRAIPAIYGINYGTPRIDGPWFHRISAIVAGGFDPTRAYQTDNLINKLRHISMSQL